MMASAAAICAIRRARNPVVLASSIVEATAGIEVVGRT